MAGQTGTVDVLFQEVTEIVNGAIKSLAMKTKTKYINDQPLKCGKCISIVKSPVRRLMLRNVCLCFAPKWYPQLPMTGHQYARRCDPAPHSEDCGHEKEIRDPKEATKLLYVQDGTTYVPGDPMLPAMRCALEQDECSLIISS